MDIRKKIKYEWDARPLRLILILAILTRLLAVIFSKGFGWFDDHFLVIEAAQSWVDGYDYNRWLPGSEGNEGPTGHNLFYTGLHYLLFRLFSIMGFDDPQAKMFVVRLLHAALSLLVIVFGYRLSLQAGGRHAARMAALLLAVMWFFPFLAVRNLVEFACVPFLMWGTWLLSRESDSRRRLLYAFLAGMLLGLAFSVRFQTLIYAGGMGLALLITGRWKEALATGAGIITAAFVCLATIDLFIWGYPFAELAEYIRYNMHHYGEYITGPWHRYLLVIVLLLVPPVSLFLLFGFFYGFIKKPKQNLLIFLPVMIFLAFHSYFPNKQERFILPIIPFIITAGTAGWYLFLEKTGYGRRFSSILKAKWAFFWVLNLALLLVISTTYSKRSRVESMCHLSRYEDIRLILVENTNRGSINLLPMYYLGQWVRYMEVTQERPAASIPPWFTEQPDHAPCFFIFEGDKRLDERVGAMQALFPAMVYEATISPGFIDRILHRLNPVNENQNAYIYRNSRHHPGSKRSGP